MLENHYFDARPCTGFWMKLYPFVKFENRPDSFGGKRFVVEAFGSTAVAEQTQGGHHRLFTLFEVDEIEFAKSHCILNLQGIGNDAGVRGIVG